MLQVVLQGLPVPAEPRVALKVLTARIAPFGRTAESTGPRSAAGLLAAVVAPAQMLGELQQRQKIDCQQEISTEHESH
ncbi:hypothetical protein [Brevibacillus borstelensis]|uniref:hypothetical protein n=1 Tax=Brevibacillus borstelensis TaxID=45462 RepID=UPI00242FB13B|nr:hypothetical protein [Brevibacillus borstelensis]